MRASLGNLINHVKRQGFQVKVIGHDDVTKFTSSTKSWLGIPSDLDAKHSYDVIKTYRDPIGVIVDHYGIDEQWEKKISKFDIPIIVIDDLADRRHKCELLIDNNLHRKKSDYLHLIPANAQQLIGPKYSIIANEFRKFRKKSLAYRDDK